MLKVQADGHGGLGYNNGSYVVCGTDDTDCPSEEEFEDVHGRKELGTDNHHIPVGDSVPWHYGRLEV